MAVFQTFLGVFASVLVATQARVGMPGLSRLQNVPGLLQTEHLQAVMAEAMLQDNITQTPGMEGIACSAGDFARYKKIVCDVEAACGCADTKCELDWCAEYVHEWKKEFGACTLTACPPKA
mmetsp:Transcript_38612/g.70234  ORF Transcript_38612/g.70234 Transcript_38612/m.70234 type:complete len:121 (-) Transcript_38612:57-419(-)